MAFESPDDAPVEVHFALPPTKGGNQPVSVDCSPGSSSTFPVGNTAVTCTATDAQALKNSCTFTVTVAAIPRLSSTTFLAFGDSITAGTESPRVTRLHALGLPNSYPFLLNDLLRARYKLQTFSMTNSGFPGEVASAATAKFTPNPPVSIGELRLSGDLLGLRPEVLLLMEGSNDLFFCVNTCPDDGVDATIDALDNMVRDGQQRGARVFLATIAPQRAGGSRNRDAVANVIPRFNDEIRALAARRGADLVDVYAAMAPNLDALIGQDDLHPTAEGHKVIAETFFAAIKTALEGAGLALRHR